jgi:hypothetical protein
VLLGNTELRAVYNGIDLDNLHLDYPDPSHESYQRYLEARSFLPATGKKEHVFWEHLATRAVPRTKVASARLGLYNVFPVDLMSDEVQRSARSSQLGFISTSPLRVELEFSPVQTEVNWLVCFSFVYCHRLTCPGSRGKQNIDLTTLN